MSRRVVITVPEAHESLTEKEIQGLIDSLMGSRPKRYQSMTYTELHEERAKLLRELPKDYRSALTTIDNLLLRWGRV